MRVSILLYAIGAVGAVSTLVHGLLFNGGTVSLWLVGFVIVLWTAVFVHSIEDGESDMRREATGRTEPGVRDR